MPSDQLNLFDRAAELPAGFRYRADVVPPADERALVTALSALPFREFEFRGFLGKRRIVSFGWHYDFNRHDLTKTQAMPDFLLELRQRAAHFADIAAPAFEHALVTEYAAGAAIGWHKDRAAFGDVVGISLVSPCVFRMRREKSGGGWQRASLTLLPRSAYLLRGPSRTEWEHSIPAVDRLRYSVTFRTLAPGTRR
jgi:alkylated DNA repair dioxygenase AlkB